MMMKRKRERAILDFRLNELFVFKVPHTLFNAQFGFAINSGEKNASHLQLFFG
jgi:hypothetical protein